MANASLKFLLDKNLGLPTNEKPWTDLLDAAGIVAELSTDLVNIDKRVARHEPYLAYIPVADFHRLFGQGDRHYRGLAINTSKFCSRGREATSRSTIGRNNDRLRKKASIAPAMVLTAARRKPGIRP